jgi:hypothetical protein
VGLPVVAIELSCGLDRFLLCSVVFEWPAIRNVREGLEEGRQ